MEPFPLHTGDLQLGKGLPIVPGLQQLGLNGAATMQHTRGINGGSPTSNQLMFNSGGHVPSQTAPSAGTSGHSSQYQTANGNTFVISESDVLHNNVENLARFIARAKSYSAQDSTNFLSKLSTATGRCVSGTTGQSNFRLSSEWNPSVLGQRGSPPMLTSNTYDHNNERESSFNNGSQLPLTAPANSATVPYGGINGTGYGAPYHSKKNTAAEKLTDECNITESIGNMLLNDDVDTVQSTLVILIPGKSHVIGHLIGESGSEITRIEAATGTTVEIEGKTEAAQSANERKVYVTGTVSSTTEAQMHIAVKLGQRLGFDGGNKERLKLVVPDEIVRHLIGKGGSNITKLQKETGVKIKVEAESTMLVPGAVGRRIVIHGPTECRTHAQYLISRQIMEDRNVLPDWAGTLPHVMQASEVREYDNLREVEGEGMGELSPTGSLEDSNCNVPKHGKNGRDGSGERPSSMTFGTKPESLQNDSLDDQGSRILHPPLPTPAEELAQPDLAIMDLGGHLIEGTHNEYSYGILVPNKAVAYLIGRGGVVITGVQHQSGAKIKIAKSSEIKPGATRRRVTLCGTKEAVETARSIIEKKLQSYDEFRGKGSSVNNQPRSSKPTRKRQDAAKWPPTKNYSSDHGSGNHQSQEVSQIATNLGPVTGNEMWGASSAQSMARHASIGSQHGNQSQTTTPPFSGTNYSSFADDEPVHHPMQQNQTEFGLDSLGHHHHGEQSFMGEFHLSNDFADHGILGGGRLPLSSQQQPSRGNNPTPGFRGYENPNADMVPDLLHGLNPMIDDNHGFVNSRATQFYQAPVGSSAFALPPPGYHPHNPQNRHMGGNEQHH